MSKFSDRFPKTVKKIQAIIDQGEKELMLSINESEVMPVVLSRGLINGYYNRLAKSEGFTSYRTSPYFEEAGEYSDRLDQIEEAARSWKKTFLRYRRSRYEGKERRLEIYEPLKAEIVDPLVKKIKEADFITESEQEDFASLYGLINSYLKFSPMTTPLIEFDKMPWKR